MEGTQFLLLGVILLAALLLLTGGAFLSLRARRQTGDTAGPLKPAADSTGAPSAANAGQPKREPPAWMLEWQKKLPPDSILVSRDPATGDWIVEMEGQRYRQLSDIHDNRAATKILNAIEGLKLFAGIAPSDARPPAAQAPAAPTAAQPGPAASRGSRQATYPAPAGSIIAQIETILQRELALRPDLAERTIHMGARPDGSLLIEVDHNFYKSPDEIPDPRVREIVMLAVRTWEKSS